MYYAGTYRFFSNILSNYGIETTFVDTTDLKVLEAAIKPSTKVRGITRSWRQPLSPAQR